MRFKTKNYSFPTLEYIFHKCVLWKRRLSPPKHAKWSCQRKKEEEKKVEKLDGMWQRVNWKIEFYVAQVRGREEKSFLVSHLSGSFVISVSSSEIFASGFNLNSCKVHAKLYGDIARRKIQIAVWTLALQNILFVHVEINIFSRITCKSVEYAAECVRSAFIQFKQDLVMTVGNLEYFIKISVEIVVYYYNNTVTAGSTWTLGIAFYIKVAWNKI